MQDQRKHQRYETAVPAEATVDGKSIPVDVVEISVEGLRLESKQFFSPDSILSVSIKMEEAITFSGWVVWSLDALLSNGRAYQTGVQVDLITGAVNGVLAKSEWSDLVETIARSNKKR